MRNRSLCLHGMTIALAMALAPAPAHTAASPLSTVWSRQPAGSPFAAVGTSRSVVTAEDGPAGIVVTQYDANGNQIGGPTALSDTNPVLAVATDFSGNVLVASSATLTSLSSAGGTNFTLTPASPIRSMAVDASGNIVLAENTWNSDLTLEKVDASGNPVFTRAYSSTGGIEELSLATDSTGNIVVAAAYEMGTIDFGGYPLTAPSLDSMVLAKLSASGDHVFSKIFNPTVAADGTYAGIYKVRAACDAKNNIVATGIIDGMGKLVMGSRSITLPSPGAETMFLAKFSATGSTSFARAIGTDGVYVEAIAVDAGGNIVTTGENRSSHFLGGVAGVFVAKFSSGGNYRTARVIASPSGTANSIAVDRASNDPVAAGTDFPANYLLKLNP